MRESNTAAEKVFGEHLHYTRMLHVAVDGGPVLEWLTGGCLVVSSVCWGWNDVCPYYFGLLMFPGQHHLQMLITLRMAYSDGRWTFLH